MRGDDLIIMQAGQASMATSSVSSGGALQLMAIVDKLENERVAGGGRCWVAHALICTGEPQLARRCCIVHGRTCLAGGSWLKIIAGQIRVAAWPARSL